MRLWRLWFEEIRSFAAPFGLFCPLFKGSLWQAPQAFALFSVLRRGFHEYDSLQHF